MADKVLKINDTVTKKLSLKGDYKGFNEFYGEHKETIYRAIINLFKSFKRKDKMKVVLILSAKINGLQWETELKFSRKESFVLTRDILPFFEDGEDYETCGEITNLYQKILTIN
jgi:hypothetical protein